MTIQLNKSFALLIPLSALLVVIFLAKSAWFDGQSEPLATGIIADLTFTVPLVYFLVIRKSRIPKFTVVPVFILGIFLASLIIPEDNQWLLTIIKNWVLPGVELLVLTLIGIKFRSIVLNFRHHATGATDFFTTLQQASTEVLQRPVSTILATEIAVLYYGILNWKRRTLRRGEFSYHHTNSSIAIIWVIVFLVVAETSIIHLLLIRWNVLVAWIAFGVSVYTALQLIGLIRSMSKRPICLTESHLFLPYGIAAEARIPFDTIKTVEFTNSFQLSESVKLLSPLGQLENPNVIIRFSEPITIHGPYGRTRTTTALGLHVDDKNAFQVAVESRLTP